MHLEMSHQQKKDDQNCEAKFGDGHFRMGEIFQASVCPWKKCSKGFRSTILNIPSKDKQKNLIRPLSPRLSHHFALVLFFSESHTNSLSALFWDIWLYEVFGVVLRSGFHNRAIRNLYNFVKLFELDMQSH